MKKLGIIISSLLMVALVLGPAQAGLVVTPAWETDFAGADAHLGTAQASGDFNGDGYADLVVTAPEFVANTLPSGGALVWYGLDTGLGADGTLANADWQALSTQASAFFGYSVAVGDVNDDAYDDLAVGALFYAEGQSYEGGVFVWYGSATGLGEDGTLANMDWMAQGNQTSAYLGRTLALGDVNGDGYDDLAAGADFYNAGLAGEGVVAVWLGSSSGLGVYSDPANADWLGRAAQEYARLGTTVALGDFDGDGYDDLVSGATYYDNPEENEGAVFVWAGSAVGLGTDGTPANADWMAEANQVGSMGVDDAPFLGKALASGDVNGDDYDDLVVSAPTYNNGEVDEGVVFLWYGADTGLGVSGTPQNADWLAQANEPAALLGTRLASADTNLDGYDELVIGGAYVGAASEGIALLWHGADTGLGPSGTLANADWTVSGEQAQGRYGWSVVFGDVNGDTFPDLFIGAEGYDTTAVDAGQVFGYYNDETLPTNPTTATETHGAPDAVWQNSVSAPAFTWEPGTDTVAGVAGYYLYFGTSATGTSATFVTAEAYDPPAVPSEGTYYLRISTADELGHRAPWATIFTFLYDSTPPSHPTAATETGGALDDTWQSMINDPTFTWSGAADTLSGVAGYYIYFGADPSGTDSTYVTEAAYAPGAVPGGTDYLRVQTQDQAGNRAPWETLFTFLYDGTPPSNPTAATETGGALDGVWQSAISAPAFTWSGAADAESGLDGYRVYFGTDPRGTASTYVTTAAYDPGAVSSGRYYLRVRTQDQAGLLADWETLFDFYYENPDELARDPNIIAPPAGSCYETLPTLQITGGGVVSGDATLAGYAVEIWRAGHLVESLTLTPAQAATWQPDLPHGGDYLFQIRTDAVLASGTHLYSAWVAVPYCYQTTWTLWLPLVNNGSTVPIFPQMDESEPNDIFDHADLVSELPLQINGRHDGAAGTGDVFILDDNLMTAGEVVQATMATADATGLQLVVYDPQGQEMARAYDGEYVVSFVVPATGSYYVYVYTDPSANNTADYELLIEILP